MSCDARSWDQGAHRYSLAEQGPFRIDLCACGMLHVTIGPVTVRLMPPAAQSLQGTLGEALRRLPPVDPPTAH
jgi:hypothetical protein